MGLAVEPIASISVRVADVVDDGNSGVVSLISPDVYGKQADRKVPQEIGGKIMSDETKKNTESAMEGAHSWTRLEMGCALDEAFVSVPHHISDAR